MMGLFSPDPELVSLDDRAETMHAYALGVRKSKDGIQQVTLSKF